MRIELYNRQRAIQIDMPRLQVTADSAVLLCIQRGLRERGVLDRLDLVEISVVSDRTIAGVHRRFLQVPGPTDVITFDHGEIFISAATAARQAAAEGEELNRELARYIVHGLLHLSGHLDEKPQDAARMWQAQEAILQALWPPGSVQRPGIASNR